MISARTSRCVAKSSDTRGRTPPSPTNALVLWTGQPLRADARLLLAEEAIAHGGLGGEITRIGGIVLELLAELADNDPQVVRVLEVVRPPDLSQQVLLGDHAAAVPHEQGEDTELLA